MVAKAENHYIIVKTENQKLTFMYTMNADKDILDNVIDYLVEINFIDQELYNDKQIIWVPRFIEKFREVYRKRGRSLPYKDGNTILVSATETRSKEKKRKVSKEKRESVNVSLTDEQLNKLQGEYPSIEVIESYSSFFNYNKSTKYKFSFIVLFLSLIIYTLFIYLAYKNYFGPAESASMSSFGRYFGIYFMFWLFVIFIKIINLESEKSFSNVTKLI